MADPYDCPTCGQTHPRGCRAHKKQARGGGPCLRPPTPGSTTCKWHGSNNSVGKAKAAERLAESQARADVARFAARTDVHPAEALLELVQYQAGVVAYWRQRVEQVDATALEWGTTKVKEGGDDRGTTSEAAPHIAYRLLDEAQKALATYATAALKAGCDERRVRLAEQQGLAVVAVLRAIVDAQWQVMATWLDRLDATAEQRDQALSEWNANLSVVAPRELRGLTDGGES